MLLESRAAAIWMRLALGTVLLVHPGCGGAPTEVESPELPQRTPGAGDMATIAQAYHILHASTLSEDNWPESFEDYDLFVCTPSLSDEHLQQIRQDVPGATLLAAMNAQMVPLGIYDGEYYQALTAAFDTSLCIQDLHTQSTVRIRHGVADYVMTQEAADVLAAFHRDVTMQVGWDGIYIDQFRKSYSAGKIASLYEVTDLFDIDGDGIADTVENIDESIETWKPYFTEQLRSFVGDEAIIVGNTGAGAVLDPSINGMTMENVGVWFTVDEARGYILNQLNASRFPFVGVVWAVKPASRVPSRELVESFGFVHFGELLARDDGGAQGQSF